MALLVRVGGSPEGAAAWKRFARAAAAAAARRTPEEQAKLDQYLDDLDAGMDPEEAKRRLEERRVLSVR